MYKLFIGLYVHLYCVRHVPKAWLNYSLFCILKNKEIDINMLSKIITLKKIKQSLKNYE